ncbi:MAG: competence/damage-inducible protein A [Oscillospiraceae bacterium]|nr:competence/damage-inducible protein A [Oscillospiraceae bacterium]
MIKINSAEILCVGTEILIGDIINTNAAYISKKFAELGINQYYQGVVGDNPARLERKINEALERCDLLVMTGGLGPTYDDLTKEVAAKCMNRGLTLHEPSLAKMKSFFAGRNIKMSENNVKQAYMPDGAIVFENNHGTAPGCAIEDSEHGKIIIMLPGPPNELVPMVDNSVVPYLTQFSECIFYSKNINIVGMGESTVESYLSDMMRNAENPTIAPYCKEGEVRLRVTAKVKTREEGEILCNATIEKIRATEVGAYIYGIDTDLETALINILRMYDKKIAAAESCTGGLISKRITDVSGASDVFDGSVVSYANDVKNKLLNVKPETLAQFGAVSEQTAAEMAEGVRKLMNADYGVSATGIAGPGGGTPEKPVGLVYIACASENGTVMRKLNLRGSREHIRHLTANYALSLAIERIRK